MRSSGPGHIYCRTYLVVLRSEPARGSAGQGFAGRRFFAGPGRQAVLPEVVHVLDDHDHS
jgi:hypothetical protein